MPQGNWDFASRIAYASVDGGVPVANPTSFIQSALYAVASQADYQMFLSSKGDLMLLFLSPIEWGLVWEQAPTTKMAPAFL